MSFLKHLSIFSSILITLCQATNFTVQNNCPYTVWAAVLPGGAAQLNQGQNWEFDLDPTSTSQGRIWARTNCKFDGSGHGTCESGDCNGVLRCQSYGKAPVNFAQYQLNIADRDYIGISLVDGYNVPMEFKSQSRFCAEEVQCMGDINGICPTELRDPGGCHSPCTVFSNNQFCCFTGSCGPTVYSSMFKEMCPDAYTYPKDDATKLVSCPAGSNYAVVFCP
uniref:Osmotin n=1 Tax=Kandelia obovata TaxID=413952 RepID=A0A1L1ZLG8_KANOB|nr:osmotin [Kandelia obovata]